MMLTTMLPSPIQQPRPCSPGTASLLCLLNVLLMMRASILLLTMLGLPSVALAQQQCTTRDNDPGSCSNYYDDENNDSCRNGDRLRHQILLANQQLEQTGHVSAAIDHSLRRVVDHAISKSNITSLVQALPPAAAFVDGYADNGVYKAPEAFAGLALKELVTIWNVTQYSNFLQLRQTVLQQVEQALKLCPNTLQVDYTHVTQKLAGGKHKPHADNCFHTFEPILAVHENNSNDNNVKYAKCNPHTTHPYHSRIAASILYLNDDFDGGQFYWANRSNGLPQDVVPPQIGRMVVFTSGPENLHGALPVVAQTAATTTTSPRRLALAMWYTLRESKQPPEPEPIHKDAIATTVTSK